MNIPVNPELIWGLIVAVFFAGGYFSLIKKMENKLKDTEKDVQKVIISQAVHTEKIDKIDEKMNKVDIQNLEILKLLTQAARGEKI